MKKLVACLLSVATMVATLYTPAFAYEGQPLGRNVAYNRTVNVSNSFNTNEYNKPDFLTDGNLERGYQTACVSSNKDNPYEDPQTWSIDLGRSYEIDKIVLYWENAAAKKYKIYVSENKTDWMEVASEEAGEKGRFKYDFAPTNARYVKIELEERTMEIYGYCMYEWQIFTVGSVEEKEVPNLAENEVLLHGHTHVPACEKVGNNMYMNPGSVSIPKENSHHGYMTIEDGHFLWKDLDGNIKNSYPSA